MEDELTTKINEAYVKYETGSLNLLVDIYRPLFKELGEKAVKLMKENDISELDLDIKDGLFFRKDGLFYNKKGEIVNLEELPKIYQMQSDYIAACSDSRGHSTPTIDYAMSTALQNLRNTLKSYVTNKI
jgi:hypothetical protein